MDYGKEIHLDRKRPDQIYYQLAEALAHMIGAGRLPAGAVLPSIQKMSDEIGISRTTIRKAYRDLLNRGLLRKKSPYRYEVETRKKTAGQEPFPSIGIILPSSFSLLLAQNNNAPLPYMEGIIDSAMAHNLSTIMLELPALEAAQEEIRIFNEKLSRRLIGLVHLGGRDHYPDRPLEAVMRNRDLAQVYLSGIPKFPNVGAVMCDEISAAESLAKRFHELNHRDIGILLLFSSWDDLGTNLMLTYASRIRGSIIRPVFERSGLNCDDRFHCAGCCSLQATRTKLKEKIQSGNLPSVYWCHNDQVAQWCIQTLNEQGIRVPEDISVVGFDGLPVAPPELTTFNMPFYAMGRRCVEMLLKYYENGINENNRICYLKTVPVPGKTLSYAKNNQ